MKCENCGKEWAWQDTMRVCPFCGSPVDVRRAYTSADSKTSRVAYDNPVYSQPKQRRRKKRRNTPITAAVLMLAAALIYFGRYEISETISEFVSAVGLLTGSVPAISEPVDAPTVTPDRQDTAAVAETVELSTLRYRRNLLSDDDKEIYDRIYAAVQGHEESIKGIKLESVDRLYLLYGYVLEDNPELFWADGAASAEWMEGLLHTAYTLKPHYTFGESEYLQMQKEVENATAPVLLECAGMPDFEKVKTVYNFITDNTEYDLAYTGKTIYELFTQGRAVCTAYSKAMQYLLNRLGIETLIITGDAGGEKHAWNLVKLNGSFYEMDATWGDPVTSDGEQHTNYNYFCITTAEMSYTHTRSEGCDLPECTQTEYNYYRQSNRYLEQYDEKTLATWLAEETVEGSRLEFKCADQSVYEYTVKKLISDKRIYTVFKMVRGNNFDRYSCRYSNNDELFIISIGVNRTDG